MKSTTSRKRFTTKIAVFVTLLPVFATSAMAQAGRSTVHVQATGVIITDSESGGLKHEATRSGGLLVGFSHQFHRWAGFEASYGYTRDTQKFPDLAAPVNVHSNIHQVTGAFVAHAPLESAVKPYALAGGGALIFDPRADVGIAFTDALV